MCTALSLIPRNQPAPGSAPDLLDQRHEQPYLPRDVSRFTYEKTWQLALQYAPPSSWQRVSPVGRWVAQSARPHRVQVGGPMSRQEGFQILVEYRCTVALRRRVRD